MGTEQFSFAVQTTSEAGKGFFAVDRPSYRQHAAVDGWEKVLAWYNKYLSTGASSDGARTGEAQAVAATGDG